MSWLLGWTVGAGPFVTMLVIAVLALVVVWLFDWVVGGRGRPQP